MTRNVWICPSPIDGLGVFAKCPFNQGDIVLSIDDSRVVDEEHPFRPGEEERHCDYLDAARVVLMQPPERHINHSCDPNTYVKSSHEKRLVLALRDIPVEEEITYDYCINGYGDTVWICHCGSSRCRREIHSDFFRLPVKFQREYLPLLDDWFRKERSAEVDRLRLNCQASSSGEK